MQYEYNWKSIGNNFTFAEHNFPLNLLNRQSDFEKKTADDNKRMKNYPVDQDPHFFFAFTE